MEDFEVLQQMLGPMRVGDAGIEMATGKVWDAAALRRGAKALNSVAADLERSARRALEAERSALGAVILTRPDHRIERDGAFVERHDNGHGFWCLSGRRGDDKFVWPHADGRFHVMSRKPTEQEMRDVLDAILDVSARWPDAPTDAELRPMEVL